jgi:parallel beta-helix repeat protein
MPSNSTPLQSLTVDYLVSGALDGSTPAPEVSRSPDDATPFDKDAQIYEPKPVEQLGVVDPDLGFGGSIGPRCIGQLLVDLRGEVAAAGAKVYVAAQKGDELIELYSVLDLAGVSVGVAAVPFVIPQGGVLVLQGASAGAEPILIRLSIETPEDPCQLLAALAIAQGEGGGGGVSLSNKDPLEVDDATPSPGTGTAASRDDHVHPHGDRGGGSLHDLATGSVAGFMSGADKTKLDGVPSSFNFGTPVEISDATNDAGSGSNFARDNHVHAHGNRGGGSLHALATPLIAGFMSPADKAALSSLTPGAVLGPREYDAVVAISGGDFTSVVAAFASGAKSVFVRPGTYTETADIVIPAGGCLEGVCPGAVTIVLTGGAQVVIDGTGRFTGAGTVSVTSGSVNVTGVGTTFTTVQAGDYILLGDSFYEIGSVTDDLNLVLLAAYQGTAIAGQSCQAQSMIVAAGLLNVNIAAVGIVAVRVEQAFRCFFRAVAVALSGAGATPAFQVLDSGSLVWETCASENNQGIGLFIGGNLGRSYSMFLLASVFRNNNGAGLVFNNSSAGVVDGCIAYQNANNGISVLGQSSRIQLLDSFLSFNDQKGIEVSPSAVATVLANCTFFNNGTDGIDFNGSDSSLVEGCLIAANGGSGVNGGSNGVIDGCQVRDNGGNGIDMQAASNDTAVSSCIVDGNGGDGIVAAGQSLLNSNRVRNNGGRGIECLNAADDGTITGNVVTGNGAEGIYIQNTSNNWVVTGNRATGNTGANFSDNAATTTVGANNFT